MSLRSKPRADSKLKNLPDALQEQLFQYLRRNTLEKAVQWLRETHEVSTSPAALSQFWSWYQAAGSLRQAKSFADNLAAQFEKMPQLKLAADQASAITQTVFELQAAQDRDPALYFALRKAERDARKLALDERKVRLLEAKAAQADAAKQVTEDKSLTPEEQLQRYRQIFGA